MFWTEGGVHVMLIIYAYKFLPGRVIKTADFDLLDRVFKGSLTRDI